MRLPDLLRETGVDPEDFLDRASQTRTDLGKALARSGLRLPLRKPYRTGSVLIASYVRLAFSWGDHPEGWAFWAEIDERWRGDDYRSRWPALEAAMGMLDSLEYELLEVGDEAT